RRQDRLGRTESVSWGRVSGCASGVGIEKCEGRADGYGFRMSGTALFFCRCRHQPWGRVAGHDSHGPLDHVEPHPLDFGSIPNFSGMAESVVEDAPLAVFAGPSDGEIAVRAVDALHGHVDLRSVEPQQHSDIVAREVLDLVDLVLEHE